MVYYVVKTLQICETEERRIPQGRENGKVGKKGGRKERKTQRPREKHIRKVLFKQVE